MITNEEKKLQRLEQQKKAAERKIREIKNKHKAVTRKRETQKKILLGALLQNKIACGEVSQEQINNDLDKFLTREADRALFGLSTDKESSEQTPEKAEKSKRFGSIF